RFIRTAVAEPQRRSVPVETSTSSSSDCEQNESALEENIKLLNIEVQLRDTALATLRQKLKTTEQERDDLNMKLEKFQTSSKRLTDLLASLTSDKAGLGYNSKVFTQAMFDCDNYYSSESDNDSWPPIALSVPLRTHSLSKGLRRTKKTYFVCKSETHLIKDCDFHARKLAQKSYASRDIHKHHAPMNHSKFPLHKVSAAAPFKSQPVLTAAARTISAVKLKIFKTRPNIAPYAVSKSKSPLRRPFIRHTSPKPSISPPRVPKDVPSLAQSLELFKTPRHSGLISPPPMLVAPPVPLRSHSPSKGLKRPKKTCFVCKSETHLIKDCDFHARKLAQNSCAPRDIHKHNAPMKHSRIPLHKVSAATPKSKSVLSAAARMIGAARPTFSKTRSHIAPYTVSKSKAPIRSPFIRHTTPKPRLSPARVNAANPSAVRAARVNTVNPSAVSAARVKAARPFAVSVAHINAVKPSVVTAIQHNHTKKVWRPKTLVLYHVFRITSASMTLKRFDYNDALGRSKSVMAWVPKRN
nr:hypothetical protein [Tanacetum cinerariifolium]